MADRLQTLAAAWRGYGRVSPLLCPVGPRRARERLQHPSVRPLPPSAFIPLSASSFAVRSTRSHSSSGSSPPSLAGHQLEPHRFSTTATTPPSPLRLTMLALATSRAGKASAPCPSLAGASLPCPTPWLEHLPPPSAVQPRALGSPEAVEARPCFILLRRGLHWRSATVPLRRAAMAATVVDGTDDRPHLVA